MRIVYVDTSVLGRVLLDEPDRPAIERAMESIDEAVSSRLLWIELRRLARRSEARMASGPESLQVLNAAEEMLKRVAEIPLEEPLLSNAEEISPSSVATLDAIHLATAVRLAEATLLDTIMTYDQRLADGAREHGLTVLAPT